ncbi:MAG: 16S rRNA (adenine(1518)-N(6)/adenine(1519)-N(6))-dimethyltransferase RsmA [Candidatus Omnitrophica bacterium]|nr:16S rRNA (adenine(1518)-N(6)/adenine(1519)-N(6))-dimethyltransferase RsmA [Candidatus Omnitrophota bacterium]
MKFYRSFGQIFLKDNFYKKKILDNIVIKDEVVVEIGSGLGEITSELAKNAKYIYCVEIDKRFIDFLKDRFINNQNVKIVHCDILDFDFSQFDKKVVVFGNVPYQISNFLIRYLVKNSQFIKFAYLTLQKEFAKKLIAKVSTKDYCFLTCFIQYYALVEKLFDIPNFAFFPKPKVDSTFLKIDFTAKKEYNFENEKILFDIIRRAFTHRRKKIINSLLFLKEKIEFLKSVNIDTNLRAENLSLQDYINLAKIYLKQNYEKH